MQIYDAAFDFLPGFTAGKNPNGCWTYGWTMNLSGVLHIFPTAGISPLDNNPQQWFDPSNDNGRTPAVTRNQNGDFDNGNVTWLAGALLLTGGGNDGQQLCSCDLDGTQEGEVSREHNFLCRTKRY